VVYPHGLASNVQIGMIAIRNLEVEFQDSKPYAATCRIHRKDRARPCVVTEYFSECFRNTDPWRQFPARMLRHKALIQCARVAFGFSGIQDEDEAKDTMRNVTPSANMTAGPALVPQADILDAEPLPESAKTTPGTFGEPEPPKPAAPADTKTERMAAIRRIQAVAKGYGIQPAEMIPGLISREIVPAGTVPDAIGKLSLATLAEIEAAADAICADLKDAKGEQPK